MHKILSVGHLTLDTFLFVEDVEMHCDLDDHECLVSFKYGAKIPVSKLLYDIGGGAANVTVGLNKLGVDAHLFSKIGRDYSGDRIINILKERNIKTNYIGEDDKPTDQSTIVTYGIDRTIFTYNSDHEYSVKSVIKDFDTVFLTSIGKNVDHVYDEIIEAKQSNRIKIFYNPGTKELKYAHHSIQKMLPFVDVLIVNVEEACNILNPALNRNHIEIDDLITLLQQKGVGNVFLTDGINGVYYNDAYKIIHVMAEKVEVIEKTGAGDAFTSGCIAGFLHGKDLRISAEWGVKNGASVVTKPGAQNGLLSLPDLISM